MKTLKDRIEGLQIILHSMQKQFVEAIVKDQRYNEVDAMGMFYAQIYFLKNFSFLYNNLREDGIELPFNLGSKDYSNYKTVVKRAPRGNIVVIPPSNATCPLLLMMVVSAVETGNKIIVRASSKMKNLNDLYELLFSKVDWLKDKVSFSTHKIDGVLSIS